MLKQRIITAVVLLAILLPAMFWRAPWPFILIILLLIAAAAWEWARLNGLAQTGSLITAAVCLLACGGAWLAGLPTRRLPWLWVVAGALWVLAGGWMLRRGVAGWPRIPRPIRVLFGVLALWLAWLAVAQAKEIGVNFLLSILVLVWIADISAYFAGRTLGLKFTKARLAPAISPGKTWEGVWGGMAGVVVLAIAWTAADMALQPRAPSLYTRLAAHGWWMLAIGAIFLTAMSVVGDLVESLVKRSAGMKDSSQLLPGHGGVLDRIDALLPTLPLAMMLGSLAS